MRILREILKYFMIAPLLILGFPGCSSTRIITPGDNFLLSEKATLVTADNSKIGIRYAQTDGDTIIASDWTYNRIYKFNYSEVKSITVKDHHKGASQGALWLGAASAATTYLYIKFFHDKKKTVGADLSGAAPFIFGIWGGSLGALVGATTGKSKTYIFEVDVKHKINSTAIKKIRKI